MVGWHHRLNGHETEQTPGDSEGQGSLARCSPWGGKEQYAAEQLNNRKGRENPARPQGGDIQLSRAQCFLRQTQPGLYQPLRVRWASPQGTWGREEDSSCQSHPLLLASFAEHMSPHRERSRGTESWSHLPKATQELGQNLNLSCGVWELSPSPHPMALLCVTHTSITVTNNS